MHRFRRKSDAKPSLRSPTSLAPEPLPTRGRSPQPRPQQIQPLPALPSDNEFRTSLILPSLSKRFTLLRNTSGDPVSLEDMRSRFAGLRAKGAEYQISEQEEELILDQLSNIRATNTRVSAISRRPSDLQSNDESSVYPESDYTSRSPPTSPSITQQSPPSSISRRQKRHSNNLFSSPQMRDASYLRAQRHGSGRSPIAETDEGSLKSFQVGDHLNGDGNGQAIPDVKDDVTSDYSTDKTPTPSRLKLRPMHSHTPSSTSEHRVNQFKRISLALSNVMREIEEEGILPSDEGTPRSAPLLDRFPSQSTASTPSPGRIELEQDVQTDMNSLNHVVSEISRSPSHSSQSGSGSVSPSPRIQGYIPGMPRPVTPRDWETEEQHRARSTTPRAASPNTAEQQNGKPSVPQGILRRGSLSAHNRALPRSDSPVYSPPSSSHGRSLVGTTLTKSMSLHERRRPVSPLNALTQQGKYSQLTPISPEIEPQSPASGGHSRQSSLAGMADHYLGFHNRSNSAARMFASPALPDSPLLDSAHTSMIHYIPSQQTPDTIDIGSPLSSASRPRSPSSPFSFGRSPSTITALEIDPNYRRSPKPGYGGGSSALSTPYTRSLALSPILNSSQSSLQSTGSSYHSTMDTSQKSSDAAFSIIRDSGSTDATSPDVTLDDQNADISHFSAHDLKKDVEEALNFFGLTKNHFINMQEQLLQAAPPDLVLTPRTPTLRRRNNSISSRALGTANGASNVGPPRLDSPITEDSHLRANALLDSVLNSIQSSITSAPKSPSPVPQASPVPISQPLPSILTDPACEIESEMTSESDAVVDESIATSYVDTTSASGGRSTSALQSLADALFGSSPTEEVLPQESPRNADMFDLPNATATDGNADRDKGEVHESQNTSPEWLAVESYDEFEPNSAVMPKSSPHLRPGAAAAAVLTPSRSPTIPTSSEASTPELDSRAGSSLARSPVSQQQLILDISRKAAEATAALKSPSQSNLGETQPTARRRPGRRVDPELISSPQLLSSSATMNTFTIYSPSDSQVALSPSAEATTPSKFSKGMQKLRGTWKGNKVLTGEEVTPWTYDDSSRTSIDQSRDMFHSLSASSTNISPDTRETDLFENGRGFNQSTESSPPATAGPSLKTFLGRFRRNRRDTENGDPNHRVHSSPRNMVGPGQKLQRNQSLGSSRLLNESANNSNSALASSNSRPLHSHQTSAPPFIQTFSASQTALGNPSRGVTPDLRHESIPENSASSQSRGATPDLRHNAIPENEEVKKLFEAASNLGLDPEELTQLLSRSTSLSSRVGSASQQPAALSRSPSGTSFTPMPSFSQALESSSSSLERENTPEHDGEATIKRNKSGTNRKGSLKRSHEQTRPKNHNAEGPVGDKTVIRRTLIFPSDGQFGDVPLGELEGLIRKASRRRRSTSGNSMMSGRSVHDRIPTPPPSRYKRMSTDSRSPPVPRLPTSVPGTPIASSTPTNANFTDHLSPPRFTRAYDSVYDMYGDDYSANSVREEPASSQVAPSESRPALQVLELANGETIWSIVNDLRNSSTLDGDDVSMFRRQSFSSEYSVSPPQSQEGGPSAVQLLFKEHKRASSKSSAHSYLTNALRKQVTGGLRPETKVFYSSTQQIGRLIDSLSKGLDSGSFNILPVDHNASGATPISVGKTSFEHRREDGISTPLSQHSETSAQLTMEERVERMLNNLEAANTQSPFNPTWSE